MSTPYSSKAEFDNIVDEDTSVSHCLYDSLSKLFSIVPHRRRPSSYGRILIFIISLLLSCVGLILVQYYVNQVNFVILPSALVSSYSALAFTAGVISSIGAILNVHEMGWIGASFMYGPGTLLLCIADFGMMAKNIPNAPESVWQTVSVGASCLLAGFFVGFIGYSRKVSHVFRTPFSSISDILRPEVMVMSLLFIMVLVTASGVIGSFVIWGIEDAEMNVLQFPEELYRNNPFGSLIILVTFIISILYHSDSIRSLALFGITVDIAIRCMSVLEMMDDPTTDWSHGHYRDFSIFQYAICAGYSGIVIISTISHSEWSRMYYHRQLSDTKYRFRIRVAVSIIACALSLGLSLVITIFCGSTYSYSLIFYTWYMLAMTMLVCVGGIVSCPESALASLGGVIRIASGIIVVINTCAEELTGGCPVTTLDCDPSARTIVLSSLSLQLIAFSIVAFFTFYTTRSDHELSISVVSLWSLIPLTAFMAGVIGCLICFNAWYESGLVESLLPAKHNYFATGNPASSMCVILIFAIAYISLSDLMLRLSVCASAALLTETVLTIQKPLHSDDPCLLNGQYFIFKIGLWIVLGCLGCLCAIGLFIGIYRRVEDDNYSDDDNDAVSNDNLLDQLEFHTPRATLRSRTSSRFTPGSGTTPLLSSLSGLQDGDILRSYRVSSDAEISDGGGYVCEPIPMSFDKSPLSNKNSNRDWLGVSVSNLTP